MNRDAFRGRLLALCILLALVVAAVLALAAVYSDYAANRDTIVEKKAMLGRVQGVIAQAGAVDQWTARLAQGLDDGVFLPGQGDALSSADLQARLVDIAGRNGAVLSSFRAMDPEPSDGIVDVGVEIALQGNLASVQATIATIESSLPLFFLEKADFRVAQTDPTPGADDMLEVQLEIHGYARGTTAAASGT